MFFAFLIALSFITLAVSTSYQTKCDTAFCKILDSSLKEINMLKKEIDEGICIPGYGQKADSICNTAIEMFSQEAPLPDDSKSNEVLYDKKIEDLERYLDAPLHVIYLKQLSLIREKSLKIFKANLGTESGSEYDAMMQADEMFRREAEDSTRQTPDWSYTKELLNFKSALSEISSRSRKIQEVKLAAAKQNQQAMQYLQMQAQQLQAIQQQIQGSGSPWNAALAYRVPDSNVNIAINYQQGRATVQLSCVPDESAPLLGSNGFVNGVTPGNVGLSFNINI